MDIPASHSKIIEDEETGERHPLREYRSVTLQDDDNDDDDDDPTTTSNKKRNQLRCLLIRDRHTDKAALSTTVCPAGQLHDGPDWPGRAHLLEHLLFLGSHEFPNENDLSHWLTQQGGNSNAYTDLELTCYYMDCRTAALDGTLQRWAAALRQPLLSETVVEREIMAVDSEHAKNKPEDTWRTYQLSKTILATTVTTTTITTQIKGTNGNNNSNDINNGTMIHPYGQFGSGCLASLLPEATGTTTTTTTTENTTPGDAVIPITTTAVDTSEGGDDDDTNKNMDRSKQARISALRQAVWDFWDRHYLASNITVTVLSSHSLDEQEAMVRQHFRTLLKERRTSSQPKNATIPTIPPLLVPLVSEGSCRCVEFVPIRPVYTLELHWPMRETASLYQEKPTRVLSHLLGDEGPGSLLHVLRHEQPWVQELSADDGSRSTSSFGLMILQLELTPAGWQHVQDIVALVYAYLRLLSSSSSSSTSSSSNAAVTLPPHIYQEMKLMGDMHFEFLGIPSSAVDAVSALSVEMHHVTNPHHYLSGTYKFMAPELNQAMLQSEFLQHLIPEHMIMIVGAPEYGNNNNNNDDYDDAKKEWQTAPWYGTQYRVTQVDPHIVATWKDLDQHPDPMVRELATHLHLPHPNEFLPSDFSLVELPKEIMTQFFSPKTTTTKKKIKQQASKSAAEETPPVCIQNDEVIQLWYKPDTEFSMPKVNIFLSFPVHGAAAGDGDSCTNPLAVETMLWTEWQNEVSNIFAYAASMAGLFGEWVANPKRATIELHVSGYSHKAALFCKRLLETTVGSSRNVTTVTATATTRNSPETAKGDDDDDKEKTVGNDVDDEPTILDEELWDRLVQKLRDQYHSFLMSQVYQHGIFCLDQCLEAVPTPRTIHERLEELNRITIQDLVRFHQQYFLTSRGIQIMVHGNLTPNEAKELGQAIPEILRKQEASVSKDETAEAMAAPPSRTTTARTLQQRIVQLPPETNFVYQGKAWNEENTNHCTVQYFPFGVVDLATNASLSLLRHLISERAFNQLRTQEQLGYVVHSQLKTSGDHVKALLLLVQGEAQDPVHMDRRMRHFWHTVRAQLVAMPTEEFETNRQALYESFMERKKNLLQESSAHWILITNQTFHFTRIAEIAQFVQTRTKQDVLRLLDKCILYGSSLTIQMFGQGVEIPATTKTTTTTTGTDETTAATTANDDGSPTNTTAKSVLVSDPVEFGRVQSLYPLPPCVPVNVVQLD